MGKKLYHGAAYYPELWDERVIEEDIIEMKKTGINVVRIGEFAWASMEPEEGKYDLSFLRILLTSFMKMVLKLLCVHLLLHRQSGIPMAIQNGCMWIVMGK